ncbi:MAG: hypothetical protein WC666_02405 [Candidatus Paceibacterota bacterium]
MDNEISNQIKDFAKSAEIYGICEKIGADFGLLIDQISELDSEIRGVLLGINKSSDFTDHIIEKLEIEEKVAKQITQKVNDQIFKILRENIQGNNSTASSPTTTFTQAQQDLSAIEQAGGFTIEKEKIEKPEDLENDDVTEADRNKILSGIEDKPSVIQESEIQRHETFTEPLVDQLLSSPSTRSEQIVIRKEEIKKEPSAPANLPIGDTTAKTPSIPLSEAIPLKPKGPDVYRESF